LQAGFCSSSALMRICGNCTGASARALKDKAQHSAAQRGERYRNFMDSDSKKIIEHRPTPVARATVQLLPEDEKA